MDFNKLVDSLKSPNGTYYLGDPWRLGEKGLTILVPIRCKAPPKRAYILASEDKEKIKITDTGSIDRLKVENKSGSHVFIRGGTVFKGISGQDRAVVQGTIVQPVESTEKPIPIEVKCVHAHRGIVSGGGFKIMDDLAPSEIYASLRSRDQHRVWDDVQRYSVRSAHRLKASGGSMNVAFSHHLSSMVSDPDLATTLGSTHLSDFGKQVMESLAKVPDYEDQVGVGIVNTDGVYGIELFDSPESWKALGKEVIKSFSEIFHQDEKIADLFTLNMDAVKDKVRAFLKELDGNTYRTDDGTFNLTDNPLITCEYTNLKGNCIHIVVSRNDIPPLRPESGAPIVPDIFRDMFSHQYNPRLKRRKGSMPTVWRNTLHNPVYDRNWIAIDMDSTIVPPVKKPKIGDGLIFGRLMERSYAFNDLQAKTGIPSATLARRLNEYTDEGYILKTDENGHAKWKLTAKGVVAASEKQQVAE